VITVRLLHRSSFLSRLLSLSRHWKPFLIILTILFVAGLNPLSEAAEPSGKPDPAGTGAAEATMNKPLTPVSFLNVVKGYRSGVREALQVVVRSQAEWSALWHKHSNELYSTPPTVLFDQEIVVAVFLGEKTTGGYDVTIVRAEQNADELVIHYQEKSPAPGSMVVQVFQQPFHIVRINREVGSKVTFRRES
jgi:protease stability complex PrcB-like protein